VKELSAELQASPDNDELRFALGFMQFAAAVENLGQSWYRYGLRSPREIAQWVPFLRLPVPANPRAEPISNKEFRHVLERFIADLAEAERTLSQIHRDTVKLGVQFGRAYFDFNADGKGTRQEALWRIYARLNRHARITEEQAASFLIQLDAGDVQWLRGYCHFLSAILEFYLAHDDSALFDHTAPLFFEKADTPYPFLKYHKNDFRPDDFEDLADTIALIHLVNLPVADGKRCQAALGHLQQMIRLSRKSWELYGKETDDDHEWIPNPRQTGVVPGVKITEEMVRQWMAFLDEAEDILSGKTLIPFWRGEKPLGVNLNRVFTEPKRFDLVLWVQGTAATPYLEEGVLTKPKFWRRLWASFNGRFIGYSLWFN